MKHIKFSFVTLAAAAAVSLTATAVAAPSLFSLQSLEKGQWTLRDKADGMKPVRRICLGNSDKLIYLQQAGQVCQVKQLKADARHATFSYSCRGASGTTTIRHETDQLVQIRSQGLENRAPFAFDYEARRTGPC